MLIPGMFIGIFFVVVSRFAFGLVLGLALGVAEVVGAVLVGDVLTGALDVDVGDLVDEGFAVPVVGDIGISIPGIFIPGMSIGVAAGALELLSVGVFAGMVIPGICMGAALSTG